jgi:hypothetical protein
VECAELKKLREQVRDIRKEMSARGERGRYMAEQSAQAFRKDELRDLLARKLGRAVAQLEQHVAQHRCQE